MERLPALAPGRDGIVFVEPADVRQFFGQPSQSRLALEVGIDDLGPGLRGHRHDRPVHEPLVDDLEALLDVGQLVAAGSPWIDAVHDPGRDPGNEDDPGGMNVAELEHPLAVPLRHEIERVLGCELEAGFLDVRVEVDDIDEAGATFICALGDRPDDRLHAGLPFDRDDLPGLDIRAEVDGQLGEALESRSFHRRQDSGSPSSEGQGVACDAVIEATAALLPGPS
jgi:hypothetical protein